MNSDLTGLGRDAFDSSSLGDTHLEQIPPINIADQCELLNEQLGEGGMGTVTKAKHRRLNRFVAIKRIKEELSKDPVALRRFAQEARAVERFEHPNIVRILDWGRDAQGPLLVLEFIDGENLKDRVDRDGALAPEYVIKIACEVCEGLQHAHEQGIIHRDIKPSNILLSNNGIAKLSDFGLVRQLNPNKTGDKSHSAAGSQVGTELYMAPEQLDDPRKADVRSDLWSLGATVFQLLTGRQPPLSRQFDFSLVPLNLQRILKKTLSGNPNDRYSSVRDLATALRSLSAASTTTSAPAHELLTEGQCRDCGTINSLDRKYCKACPSKLVEPCLHCNSDVPVWDKNCPNCGPRLEVRQKELLEKLRLAHEAAERLLSNHEFNPLLSLLAQTEKEFDHPRLVAGKSWIGTVRKSMEEVVLDVQDQARKLVSTEYRFDLAADLLGQLPSTLRDPEFFVEVLQKRDRVAVLEKQLNDALQMEHFHDADAIGSEIRQLQPFRQDIEKQLLSAADIQHAKAAEAASSFQDFSTAVQLLETLPERLRNPTTHSEYRLRRDQVFELEKRIRTAIDEHDLKGLNSGLEELHRLQPLHRNREHWTAELSSAVEAVHLQARGYAATTSDYMAAVEILAVVPEALIQKSLLQELSEKRDRVSRLESALHLAIDRDDIKGAYAGLEELQKLRPHKCDAIERLRDRTTAIVAEARAIAEKDRDYNAAARRMEILPEQLRDARLYGEIVRKRSRVVELRNLIESAINDERLLQADEFVAELGELLSVPTELEARLAELARSIQEKAGVFIEERQQYGPGEELLADVPTRLRNSRYDELSKRRREIEAIVASTTKAIQKEDLHTLDKLLQDLVRLQPRHAEIRRFEEELHRITRGIQRQAKSVGGELFDYARAVTYMELVPESVRNKDLYRELVRLRDLVSSLERKLRRSEESRNWAKLQEYADRLLKLQPMRPFAETYSKLAMQKLSVQKMKSEKAAPNKTTAPDPGRRKPAKGDKPEPGHSGKQAQRSTAPQDEILEQDTPPDGTVFGEHIYDDDGG